MRVRPSVVIGLGSSGAYVISNLERLLYEVLGNAPLDWIRLVAMDTDTTRKEDEPPPGGRRGQNLPFYESNLGRLIRDLRDCLHEHFTWCGPTDLHIQGPGAGNLRLGGRLMLFGKLPEIWAMVRDATHEVEERAKRPETDRRLREELARRGVAFPSGIVNASETVVYVVGTLAGGTGSGSSIDLGYLIRDAAPRALRVGLFFIPDRTAAVVFQENTWAALRDLEHFCQNPGAFHGVWPSANRTPHPYAGEPGNPYDQVYLLSPVDEYRALKLRYAPSASSPLVTMTALQLAADLLGLYEHRAAILSNLNAQVPGERKHQMFLNFNLRAVCYPKYEISEAAACRVVAESICGYWLDNQYYSTPTGRTPIREEQVRSEGRQLWNQRFDPIWRGAQSAVNLGEWAQKVLAGDISEPEANLRHQYSGNVQGTIYSQIAQQLPNRLRELQRMAAEELAVKLVETCSLRVAELYLEGLKQELKHTLDYWSQLGIPPRRDDSAWLAAASSLFEDLFRRKSRLGLFLLNARREFLRDELQEALTRLEMYLLRQTLDEFSAWVDSFLGAWLGQLRRSLMAVQGFAESRERMLESQLAESSAPVLRLSRSSKEGFPEEIRWLAATRPEIRERFLKVGPAGDFEGLFAVRLSQDSAADSALFLTLKSLLQPELLRKLEEKGPVDILQEVKAQDRVPQAVSFLKDTLGLSVATGISLVKSHTAVPSFVLARTESIAESLLDELHRHSPDLPPMRPKSLPIFDHMAIFYQEGAKLDPGLLSDADSFRRAYEQRMSDPNYRAELLDPIGVWKRPDPKATTVTGGQP